MASIQQIRGFEILDSRGNPTVAAEVAELGRHAVFAGRSAIRSRH
ncbi:hypothetical protein [Variovorax sp. Sphag1AA]|nr:hypothetical protein [Variovorax sp. Sphag1AA]MBB3178323.1 enolase [Variovorax sp. Sphag1AA]